MADDQNTQATAPAETKAHERLYTGVVISDKNDKTIVVRWQRLAKHPLYKKYIRRDKKLHAHDENNDAHIGDRVELLEVSRPLSKTKRYVLKRILERAK
jgi:small subunit ribosomal protein S17